MNRKTTSAVISLLLVLALTLTGCGSKKAPALKEGEVLKLTEWSMNATAWSSPNGATVNLTATPNGYLEGQSAEFIVRLEGEDIAVVPCAWDGSVYTASTDLNAIDGYCYFVRLTGANGSSAEEIPVNTPNAVTDSSLINMATALNAYCEATVTESKLKNGALVVEDGSIKIQLPFLTLDTGSVVCEKAELVLIYNGEHVSSQTMSNPSAGADGIAVMDISGISFPVPAEMEDDHQLSLQLNVTLSNGHGLTAPAGTWYYLDGQLLLAVG